MVLLWVFQRYEKRFDCTLGSAVMKAESATVMAMHRVSFFCLTYVRVTIASLEIGYQYILK